MEILGSARQRFCVSAGTPMEPESEFSHEFDGDIARRGGVRALREIKKTIEHECVHANRSRNSSPLHLAVFEELSRRLRELHMH